MLPYIKVYADASATIDLLSDNEAGRLLKALVHYANGETDDLPGQEKLVFAMLKAQIDRDSASYQQYCDKQRENGKKGGRPKNPVVSDKTQENPAVFRETQKSQNKDNNKEKEEDKEKNNYDGSACARITDEEITASLEQDAKIEEEARRWGLPCKEGHMIQARDKAREYSIDWLLRAIATAGQGKEQTWRYVSGILQSWKENGGPDAKRKPMSSTTKVVSAQQYSQREYTEEELMAVSDDLVAEARKLRGND